LDSGGGAVWHRGEIFDLQTGALAVIHDLSRGKNTLPRMPRR
jgi:hypothetical protein